MRIHSKIDGYGKIFHRKFFHNSNLLIRIVYNKSYFNLAKIFVLKLFKMAANQRMCPQFKQRSVMKYFVSEMCKPCEIY